MAADGEEAEMKVGVKTARDLVWKEALDAFTCTECGRCKDACPTFLTGKPLSIKWVNDSVKHHLLDIATRSSAPAKPGEGLPALVPDVISEDTLWACTTCGYCEAACPIQLEHLPRFYRLRQHQVMMEGAFPHELNAVFQAYEVKGNPWGLPPDTRGDWAAEPGRCRSSQPGRRRGPGLALLCRLRRVLRSSRPEDRARPSPSSCGKPTSSSDPRPRGAANRRMRAPAGNEMLFQ